MHPHPKSDDSTGQQMDDDAEDAPVLGMDERFHILQNERRRRVLRYLDGTEGQVRMRDVAEQVAAWEHDTTVEALMSDERQRVYIALYQTHLPKLDEKGVIEYNQSRGIVERTEVADELSPYLEVDRDEPEDEAERSRWSLYYLAAAGTSTVLLASSAVLAVVPTTSLAVVILGLFSLVTGANLFDEAQL
jgi:hypothetical protein